MLDKKKIIELAKEIAKDSEAHGYEDRNHYVFRTLTKASCEIAEAVEAYRDRRNAGLLPYIAEKEAIKDEHSFPTYGERLMKLYDKYVKNSVQDEMADAAIYMMLAIAITPEIDYLEEDYGMIYLYDDFVSNAGIIQKHMLNKDDPHAIICAIERWCNDLYGQELETFIRLKMEYNHYRPYRHGRINDPTV